ncbi:MAG: hypothetical protein M0Q12_07780 [Synergistaceae bacterium]|jgi:hypothetical protein|nr:hypothetical protein [Synergistaceae bacterium]MDD2261696.1 hypothetical protein [Clostridia bacterium]MDD3093401.1 hypothetical protein [Clostridia bacterium]MDD3971336.1 hypothetical protein [Clostridia bacterium]
MKKYLYSTISLLVLFTILTSCGKLTTCEEIELSEITMLIDVSDEQLFTEIFKDFEQNLPYFMKNTPFANLGECEEATLTIGNLSGKDELIKRSKTIRIDQKGLSGAGKRKRGNPSEVIALLKKNLDDFETLSKDPAYNSATNIIQTLIKAVLEMNVESENTLLVFSDMIINNKTESINFYKKIPEEPSETMDKLIDNVLWNNLRYKIEEGLDVKIVIVLKSDYRNKVNKKTVKEFWIEALNYIGFTDIQVIDNLSNKIV